MVKLVYGLCECETIVRKRDVTKGGEETACNGQGEIGSYVYLDAAHCALQLARGAKVECSNLSKMNLLNFELSALMLIKVMSV